MPANKLRRTQDEHSVSNHSSGVVAKISTCAVGRSKGEKENVKQERKQLVKAKRRIEDLEKQVEELEAKANEKQKNVCSLLYLVHNF